jgi:hypothetical protein
MLAVGAGVCLTVVVLGLVAWQLRVAVPPNYPKWTVSRRGTGPGTCAGAGARHAARAPSPSGER